jgi:hypothetical protein
VPFRWLDKLFSGGRVTAAFHLEKKAAPSTRRRVPSSGSAARAPRTGTRRTARG